MPHTERGDSPARNAIRRSEWRQRCAVKVTACCQHPRRVFVAGLPLLQRL